MLKEATVKKILTIFIVLLPILAVMKLPIAEVGVGIFGLILFLPLLLWFSKKQRDYKLLFLLALFVVYCTFTSSDEAKDYICWALVFVWIFLGKEIFDYIYAMRIVKTVSIVASLLTILQTMIYYLFDLHLICTLPALIQDDLKDQYSTLIYTSMSNGMYRPSAFFLEPSHMAKYVIIGLIGCLFVLNETKRIRAAIVISLGIVCTTSSVGVVMVGGVWGLFLFWKKDKGFIGRMTRKQVLFFLAGLLFLIGALQMPIVKTAIQRVIGTVNGYNAIKGRLFFWDTYFSDLAAREWLWGRGANTTGRFFTGVMDLLYSSGIVAVILFYALIILGVIRGRVENRIVAGLYAVLMIFSGLNGTINLIFYFVLVFSVHKDKVKYSI